MFFTFSFPTAHCTPCIILDHLLSTETLTQNLNGVCLENKQYGKFKWSPWCHMVTATLIYFLFLGCFLWQCHSIHGFQEPVLHFPSGSIHPNIFSAYWTPWNFLLFCSKANASPNVPFKPLMSESTVYKMQIPQFNLGLLRHSGEDQDSAGLFHKFSGDFYAHWELLFFSFSKWTEGNANMFLPWHTISLPYITLHHRFSMCGPGVAGNSYTKEVYGVKTIFIIKLMHFFFYNHSLMSVYWCLAFP